MLNKLILSIALIAPSLSIYAQSNTPFKSVSNCESDYFNGNFCSKKNIKRYQQALLTQKPNFSQTYILLNTGNSDSLELIALDTKTGIAYPLNYQFTGWEDNKGNIKKKPAYTYSLNDSKVCLSGSQYDGDHPGTHETYSNIRNCFIIKKERNHTAFESTYLDEIQYTYDSQTKTWKPIKN